MRPVQFTRKIRLTNMRDNIDEFGCVIFLIGVALLLAVFWK